jgi:hypothetical protein
MIRTARDAAQLHQGHRLALEKDAPEPRMKHGPQRGEISAFP